MVVNQPKIPVLEVVSLLSCLESGGLANLEDRYLMRVRFCGRESGVRCWRRTAGDV